MIDRRELLKNLGLLTGLSTLPFNELLANDEKVIKNNVMPNMDAANAFTIGVCFGQIQSYALMGTQYDLIQRTINFALEVAKKMPQLNGQQPYFPDLLIRLRDGQGINDAVTNGVSVAGYSNFIKDELVKALTDPNKNVVYAGYFLGIAEARALTGAQDASLNEALTKAISTALWTNPEGLINWAKSRLNTPYYQKAIYGARRLLHSELVGRPQQFSAGAANVPIVIGAGQSIVDQTYARALVIDDGQQRGAIVQVDTTTIDVIYSTPIKELVNSLVKMDGIMLVATHTHSPSNSITADQTPTTFTSNVADAIIIAAGDLVAAEVGVAKGVVLQSFNRVKRTGNPPSRTSVTDFYNCLHPNLRLKFLNDRPLDPVNNNIDILHIRSILGTTTIATLVNYAAHAVVLKFNNPVNHVSADYPGAIVDYVSLPRDQGGLGGECLFLQGAAGDIHPFCCLIEKQTDAVGRMKEMAADIGRTVVAETLSIAAYESSFPILFTEQLFNLKDKWRFYAYDPLNPNQQSGPFEKYQTYISALLLGKHIALVGMPGEFFTSLGQDLRRKSPCKNTFFLGYCNDFIAYVPSTDDWETGAYGTTNKLIRSSDGHIEYDYCRIEKGVGEEMVGQAVDLIGNMMKK